jgi:hypothetical protein
MTSSLYVHVFYHPIAQVGERFSLSPSEAPVKKIKRVRIAESVVLAPGGKPGRDIKLIAKALGDRSHLTIMITRDGIDVHLKDEKTGVYTPRLKISLADKERTRQLLGLLKPLSKITDAMAIDVPKAGAPEALRSRLTVRGRDIELPRMTPTDWEKGYWELYTEIPIPAFAAVNATWGLLIGSNCRIIGYAFKIGSESVGVLKSDLEALS